MSIETGDIMTNNDIMNMLSTSKKGGQGQSCRVETIVQEPQSVNTEYCKFNINSGGILDKSSRVKLNVYANGDNTQLPPISGVLSLIDSVELKSSQGQVIAATHDFQHISTCRQCWVNQEQRKNRNSKVLGTYNVYDYHSDGTVQLVDRPSNLNIGNGAANYAEYTITIEQMFPELFPYMLPVFCIADNLQLCITWSSGDVNAGGRGIAINNANPHNPVVIDNNSVQFVADHLYFDVMTMNRILQSTQSRGGLVVPYANYQLVKNQISTPNAALPDPGTETADTSITITNKFNIGLSGLSVRYMLMMIQNQGINAASPQYNSDEIGAQQRIVGKYGSTGPIPINKEKLQIVVNNVNYFQKELDTPARMYNELVDVFGVEPSIPWCVYTNEQNYFQDTVQTATDTGGALNRTRLFKISPSSLVRTDGAYHGNVPKQYLGGALNFKGVNFSYAHNNSIGTGMRVSETPLEISYDYPWCFNDRTGTRLIRIYSCVERVLSIENGNINVDFS